MGRRSTIAGYWRARGATSASSSRLTGPTPGVVAFNVKVEFDATQASTTGTGVYLPAGARVMSATSTGEASAGTVDVGTAADVDGFAAAIDADGVERQNTGALLGAALAADVEVTAGDNTGGGGTATVYLEVVMDDDGSIQD